MTHPTGARYAARAKSLQSAFLDLLPRIRTHAAIAFRHLKCPGKRDDAVAEVVGVCWKWYLRLMARGKDPRAFVSTLAGLAARAVRCGRKVAGMERSKDALNPQAQRRFGFRAEPLPARTARRYADLYGDPHGQGQLDAFEQRLRDNTVTRPPEQAAFRIDFPRWLAGLGERDRRIAADMMHDEPTRELAARHRLSQGRISQLRRQFHRSWRRFHGEAD